MIPSEPVFGLVSTLVLFLDAAVVVDLAAVATVVALVVVLVVVVVLEVVRDVEEDETALPETSLSVLVVVSLEPSI